MHILLRQSSRNDEEKLLLLHIRIWSRGDRNHIFHYQLSCILDAGKLQELLFDTVLSFHIIFHTIDIIFDNHLLFDQIHYYHGYAAKVALLAEWNDVKFNISDPGPIRHGKNNHIVPLYDK